MNSEIKKITGRIHEISERKNQLGLNVVTSSTKAWHMPPSSYLPEGLVIGRDADKRKITDLLLKEAPPIVNFHVVGIVGMPGVGKTTLARHVFCYDAMKDFCYDATRDANVAKMMGSTVYQLDCISDDQCWKVFEHHSLLDITNNRPQNFELVKKKIVAKCSRLPLAARTLGGLLRCKQVEEWEEILNNKMWSLSDNSGILPVLKLSYHYLPASLKRCFAYCSLLPNDYEFGEKQLILLWVAEGLVQQQPEDKKQFEDTGSDYFQELLSRSLFQKASKGNDKYVMHDLVGELARWAAAEICFSLEDKGNDDLQLKTISDGSSYVLCQW